VQESQLVAHFDAVARKRFAELGIAVPTAELLAHPDDSGVTAPAIVSELLLEGIPAGVARLIDRKRSPTEDDMRDADKALVSLVEIIASELLPSSSRGVTRSWGGLPSLKQLARGIWPWG
jgi:hypothetical protein